MVEKADYLDEEKVQGTEDRYALVVAAAKRARQLNAGAPPLLILDSEKPIVTALEELATEKIKIGWSNDKLPEKKRFTT